MPEKTPRKPWVLVLVVILLIIILKQSFHLRSIGYDQIPETYVILDERTNVWHGLSIRASGVPAAWSNLELYKWGTGGDVSNFNLSIVKEDIRKYPNLFNFVDFPKPIFVLYPINFGAGLGVKHISFVQPYLDHPPLGAIVLSSFVSSDVKTFSDLSAYALRRASLWLGVLTGVLIFTLGWQVSKNPFIGLIATAIYGTVPTFNLLSRYALLENVLNPFMLLTINLLVLVQKIKGGKFLLILGGVASGLAALTKITGWFVLVIGIVLLIYWKVNLRGILLFVVPSVFIGLLYFAWGLYLAPSLFIDIFRYQGLERGFIGSINFIVSATRVGILNFPLDGFWIGGFISLILISFKKEYAPIFVGAVVVLISALLLGGANFPWYFIPAVPFMCLATAQFFWQVATNPKFISILIFFLIFVSSAFYWGYGVFQGSLETTNYQQPYALYRILMFTFIGIGLAWMAIPRMGRLKKLWFFVMIVVILLLIRLNERSIYYILSNWGKLPSLYTPGTF